MGLAGTGVKGQCIGKDKDLLVQQCLLAVVRIRPELCQHGGAHRLQERYRDPVSILGVWSVFNWFHCDPPSWRLNTRDSAHAGSQQTCASQNRDEVNRSKAERGRKNIEKGAGRTRQRGLD